MEIAYHIGAPCTDGDRLLRSLLRNVGALAGRGVAVPGPGRYRKALREAVQARVAGAAPPGDREALLDAMLDGRRAERTVLSTAHFLAFPGRVAEDGAFLPRAEARAAALRAIFPDEQLHLFLGLRDLATHLPAAWAEARGGSFEAWMGGMDPRAARWSEVVAALRRGAPDASLTVWCNEDTPLLWGEVLARLAGLDPSEPLEGRHDLLSALLSAEGAERFASYMEEHPAQGPAQERRVVGAFFDKYAVPEETWDEVDLPGWDEALVADLSRLYEEDVERVAALDCVTFLRP